MDKTERNTVTEFLERFSAITEWGPKSGQLNGLWTEISKTSTFGNQGSLFVHMLIKYEKPISQTRFENNIWIEPPAHANAAHNTPGPPSVVGELPKGKLEKVMSFKGDAQLSKRNQQTAQANQSHNGYGGIGLKIMRWLIGNRDLRQMFTTLPNSKGIHASQMTEALPLSYAIAVENHAFVACFISLYEGSMASRLSKVFSSIAESQTTAVKNVLHDAVSKDSPYCSLLMSICPKEALMERDKSGRTPFHLALRRMESQVAVPPMPACFKPRGTASHASGTASHTQPKFSPRSILETVQARDDAAEVLPFLLASVSEDGKSLLQDLLEIKGAQALASKVKELILETLTDSIDDLSLALYGNSGEAKELCLNLADFDWPTSNLDVIVSNLRESATMTGTPTYETVLLFVHLPHFDYSTEHCSLETLRELFECLGECGVKTICNVIIPDSRTRPLSEVFVQRHILSKFRVQALDWRKLDINLDALFPRAAPESAESLTSIKLYASGNHGVLYHWSTPGLLHSYLPKLNRVELVVCHLDKYAHDAETYEGHAVYCKVYIKEFVTRLVGDDPNLRGLLTPHPTMVDWVIPQSGRTRSTADFTHDFSKHLKTTFVAMDWLGSMPPEEAQANGMHTPTSMCSEQPTLEDYMYQFRDWAMPPRRGAPDRRVRVAVIDNGTQVMLPVFKDRVARGHSFIFDDEIRRNHLLSWYWVSDPHGTQMASLVAQTNPYCQLYIARVARHHDSIRVHNVIKALEWATNHDVDVISMSFAFPEPSEELERAVEAAAKKNILMFAATSDNGVHAQSYPAEYSKWVISVSGTDRFGHLTSRATPGTPPDVRIPSENVAAESPVHIGAVPATVSGSSVATALAAGLASLSLVMLRTYNEAFPTRKPGKSDATRASGPRNYFHTKEGMLNVFYQMSVKALKKKDDFQAPDKEHVSTAITLDKMFPAGYHDMVHEDVDALARLWDFGKWPYPITLSG